MATTNLKVCVATMAIIIGALMVSCVNGSSKKQEVATESKQKTEPSEASENTTVKIGNIEWATCNLGAEKQSDCGSFFTWAEA